MNILDVKEINSSIEEKQILKNLSFHVKTGEILVIMGPNGCGKSTLAQSLMGHPKFEVSGNVLFDNKDLLSLEPHERSINGLFLSFQYPVEIEGVTVSSFLRQALNARREKPIRILEFKKKLHEYMKLLHIDQSFASRYLNKGFSGGEKKKMEILQLLLLEPKLAILDETDSGLDVDALRKVSEGIAFLKQQNKDTSIIVITHYERILDILEPDRVIVMYDGSIVKQGGKEIVTEIQKHGFEQFYTK